MRQGRMRRPDGRTPTPERLRRRSLVLAGLGGAGVLAATGCAHRPEGAAAPAGGGQPTEITILTPTGRLGPAGDERLDQQVFTPAYARFRDQTGIMVAPLKLPEALIPDKVTTLVAAGTPPEGSHVHPQWLGSMAARGLVVAIEPYVAKDRALNPSEMLPALLDYFRWPTVGGRLYGLAYSSGPSVTFFNRTLFERLGVKPPDQWEREGAWTWETMRDVAIRLTGGAGETKTWGWAFTTNLLNWLNVPIWGHGGDLWDKDLTRTRLGEPAAVEALQAYADLRTRYGVVAEGPEALAVRDLVGGAEFPSAFHAGRAAMMYSGKGEVPSLAALARPGFQPGVAPVPRGRRGRFVRNGPNSYLIVKDSRQPDAVYRLMAWMTTAAFQALQLAIGASVPVRRSQLDAGEFRRSLQPWEPLEVWQQAAVADRALPLSARHSEIQQRFGPAYDRVRAGEATVKEIMPSLVPQIDTMLREARASQP
jgi:ABC-type glycerol-3-phosphate transport system substrate-binding protein